MYCISWLLGKGFFFFFFFFAVGKLVNFLALPYQDFSYVDQRM